jgi:ribonuclease P protein component
MCAGARLRDDSARPDARKTGGTARGGSARAGGCTLAKRQRLREPGEFREAFNQGRPTVGRYLVMWQRRARDARKRLGVIASKRTLRRAVDRSRAKRLMREAYRRHRDCFRGNRDIVLIARRPISHASLALVEDELLRLARRGGCLAP